MDYEWPSLPHADPIEIHEGSHVRVRMTNHSMMLHPMHLHGHFFRVANVLKDTLVIPPMMGRGSFQFVADNPGRWLFHCHNIYHMEAGMAREVRYV
jgi:multicopper oxidase